MVRAPECSNTAGASFLRLAPWRARNLGAKERRHKGSARVGTPKICGIGGRRRLARFWGALAWTAAGATLMPLCAFAFRSKARVRNPIAVSPSLITSVIGALDGG